jgi:predicted RNA-binding protein with TRAM domain
MTDTPYLAIGNEELGTPVSEGDIVAVTIDGTRHEGAVKFGDRIERKK